MSDFLGEGEKIMYKRFWGGYVRPEPKERLQLSQGKPRLSGSEATETSKERMWYTGVAFAL